MKKTLKLVIFLLILLIAAAAVFAVIALNDVGDRDQTDTAVFDRKPLDKASVFGDYVFEEKIRETLKISENEKINSSDLAEIKQLDLSYNGTSVNTDKMILSLDGLKYFKSLESLIIDGNQIKSLEPIVKCSALTSLSCVGCEIEDNEVNPIGQLTNLTYLCIRDNRLSSIEFLSELSNLETLDASQNDYTEATVFLSVPFRKLKSLSLATTELRSLIEICKIESLEYLDVTGLDLHDSDVECLKKLKNLSTLICRNNWISDAKTFSVMNMPSLRTLDLYDNSIESLEVFEDCVQIENLDVSANMLYDLKGIEKLSGLKVFKAINNHISAYGKLNELPKLEIIKVDDKNACKGE